MSELEAKLESAEQRLADLTAASTTSCTLEHMQPDATLTMSATHSEQLLAAAVAGEEATRLQEELEGVQRRLSGLEERAARVAELEAQMESITEVHTLYVFCRGQQYAYREFWIGLVVTY